MANHKIALVVGNGLTRSLTAHLKSELDSSLPFRWPVAIPPTRTPLLHELAGLNAYLERIDPHREKHDFDLIAPFAGSLSPVETPDLLPDHEYSALLDLGHYLALAYAWFQLELDKEPWTSWDWAKWFLENGSSITCLLSWNYDLVAERLLRVSGRHVTYAGIQRSIFAEEEKENSVLVAKPHGSCNFAPGDEISFSAAEFDGDTREPPLYPRLVEITGYDGPMQTLPDRRLLTRRQVADIVLPGERNRFKGYLEWVSRAIRAFKIAAGQAGELVIVGFSMGECDRPEFEEAIRWAENLRRIVVADPNPNPRLMDVLCSRGAPVVHWPDGPFERSEVLC